MLIQPVSLVPVFLFVFVAVLCFSAWSGIIPFLPSWMSVLGLYLGCAAFVFACMCFVDWIADHVTRYANIADIVDPNARIMEAIATMNKDQLELLYNLWGYAPDDGGEGLFITLENGEAVRRDAILEMEKHRDGDKLQPERDYHHNTAGIHMAYDALNDDKTIHATKPGDPRKPKLINSQRWEKYVQMAKGLV